MQNTTIRTVIFLTISLILTAVTGSGVGYCQIKKVPDDLTELSLLELSEIEVTTVSKKKQKLSEAASAVFVITQEDIRRSGVTNIPEALRMAPGLQVARLDSNRWAVSSRGFNDQFANKLLVLVDGRSVYTHSFAGVRWEVKDMLLEDIERIEVIRGPGASLWGANAVNGVINIITKKAEQAQGGLLIAGGGSDERAFGGLRYGGKLGDNAFYRIYTKFFNRDSFVDGTSHDAADGWEQLRGGFRVDWNISSADLITFSGSAYNGNRGHKEVLKSLSPPFEQEIDLDSDTAGGHLLGRWSHTFSDTSDMLLQLYYDRTEWDDETTWEIRNTIDVDFQQRLALGNLQEILWGIGYRFTEDDFNDRFTFSVDPSSRGDNIFNTFVQDEIKLVDDKLSFTLGAKFEHNDYTGIELQPNGRLAWTPNKRNTLWTAVSRAVRTPARVEDDGRINSTVFPNPFRTDSLPILVALLGDHDAESEDLLAFELGYRLQASDKLSLDFAAFYNTYDNLRTVERKKILWEKSPVPSHLLIPVKVNNYMDGETVGIEMAVNWQIFDWWRLKNSYTYLDMELHLDGKSNDILSEAQEDQSPQNQLIIRSMIDIPWNIELDTTLRYVDSLHDIGVESYISLDVHFGWKPKDNIEISIVGQNLLDSDHLEFTSVFFDIEPIEIERGVYGSIKWQF